MSSGPEPEAHSIDEQGVTLLVRVTPKASQSTFVRLAGSGLAAVERSARESGDQLASSRHQLTALIGRENSWLRPSEPV